MTNPPGSQDPDEHEPEPIEASAEPVAEPPADGAPGGEVPGGEVPGGEVPAAAPPNTRKLALVVAAGIVALLVVLGAGIGVYAWLHDSPSDVADKWLTALKEADYDEMKGLSCGEAAELAAFLDEVSTEDPSFFRDQFKDTTFEVTGEKTRGRQADVEVKVTSRAGGQRETTTSVLKLEDQDGWRVCDFDDNLGGPI